MKKRFACLAALALLCASLCAFAAAEEIALCLPGDSVEVTFTLLANPSQAVAATMRLEYDHQAMALIPNSVAQNDGTFLLDMNGIPEGTTVTVGFQLLPNIPGGEYEIRLVVVEAGDINEKYVDDMAFSVERVMVADLNAPSPTEEPAPQEDTGAPDQAIGDVTGDGNVDVFDAIRLRRFIAGEDVEVDRAQCDLNGDGQVDIFDLIRLQKALTQNQ